MKKIINSVNTGNFSYLRIAGIIEQQILTGTLPLGYKLPSLRTICREYGVSQTTALKAYYHLEGKMLIESRPQSGYYAKFALNRIPGVPKLTSPAIAASYADNEHLVSEIYGNMGKDTCLPLSLGAPANELLPIAKLNKGILSATRELKGSGVAYDSTEGSERLRRQVAHWSFAMECHLTPDDIITTGGCLNAVSWCMMALTEKGDTIAMESPVSFGMLQVANSLGLKVLELPTHPQTGIDLDTFEQVLKKDKIDLCLLISNFSNPLGSCMPDDHKRAVVSLIEKYQVPLIENDINGDIYFGPKRPKSCKTYDKSGLVLWCGSVSKTLAPGYRVGWVAPGKFREKIRRMKLYHSISAPAITQEVIASFLETGRYENHLRKLRHKLHGNLLKYAQAIADHFPDGTMASRPEGGSVLWVELPKDIDTMDLYKKAIASKISFAPGKIFTLQNQYHHCLRLNYGLVWNDELEHGLMLLGRLARL